MKILFVGESWQGSSARSMREALSQLDDVSVDEIGEDHYWPKHRSRLLRAVHRALGSLYWRELQREIGRKVHTRRPDVLIAYKGNGIGAPFVRKLSDEGVYTVNVFPDHSPQIYGTGLRTAMGQYDLVISTKPFHPAKWQTTYGYRNNCVCVPHGYDPRIHFWADPPRNQDLDLVLVSTHSAMYEQLMCDLFMELAHLEMRVVIAGPGWENRKSSLPSTCQILDAPTGRAYGELLRRSKMAIAPVRRTVATASTPEFGDEDTTRTYELAAAGCFFLHRRTPFVQTLYDEGTEVPMWDDVKELAQLIATYLPLECERRAMAARAHARAVPAYSIPSRAKQVLDCVRSGLAQYRRDRDDHK
jgi:spore maturation protein CgeB